MSDIWTMVWKESKDVLFQGGWRSLIRPLFVIGIMGMYLPLQFGSQWVALRHLECCFCFPTNCATRLLKS